MKSVSPEAYDKDYYLSDCTDYETFRQTQGRKLGKRLFKILSNIKIAKGEKILDVGSGRGETVFYCAQKRAWVVGIDYASAAIKLAAQALTHQTQTVKKQTSFILANSKNLPFANNSFDKILLFDIVEHLYPEELNQVMREINRVLKPKGELYIHTAPNKILVDFTFPFWIRPVDWLLVSVSNLLNRKHYSKLSKKIRTDSHRLMHVNEMTFWKLSRLLNKHRFRFSIKLEHFCLKPFLSWKDKLYNCLVGLYPFSLKKPLICFFANEFFIKARKY